MSEPKALVHEVAMARPELMREPDVQRIIAHHTMPYDCGRVFAQTRPKLAVFTHIVQLASPTVAPPSIEEIMAQTRQAYDGPLMMGEDLMSLTSAIPSPCGDSARPRRRPEMQFYDGSLPTGWPKSARAPQDTVCQSECLAKKVRISLASSSFFSSKAKWPVPLGIA
jgi:hypothetical protein